MHPIDDSGSKSEADRQSFVTPPDGSSSHFDHDLNQLQRSLGTDSVTRSYLPRLDSDASQPGSALAGSAEPLENQQTVISQRPVAAPRDFYRQMPLADLAEVLEGHKLDHFAVQQIIGGGGMGAVFRGLDERLDRTVAIKVIPGTKRDPETLRRFRLEAQAAARLDHPNIARVFYVGEAEQWNYIVFEFIDGVNIRDLVELEGPLSVDDAVFYTRQVAEALQHAHERGVVHRDIKPSNILVTANGTAKLVDMGLARDTSPDRSSRDQTASGITLGTFDYISPEQARNPRDADVRSDLYSLGCSLFYMLTGHPPFPEGTALQKLLNHGSLPPPDPRGWRDDLSDQLHDILMKLMAKRPSDRYQRPIELVNDLVLLAELEDLPRSKGPTTLALTPTVAQPTLLEAHLPWLVAVAFLVGSALWLQSQSLSNGFALPTINFPSASIPAADPVVSAAAVLGSGQPANPAQPPGPSSPSASPERGSPSNGSLGNGSLGNGALGNGAAGSGVLGAVPAEVVVPNDSLNSQFPAASPGLDATSPLGGFRDSIQPTDSPEAATNSIVAGSSPSPTTPLPPEPQAIIVSSVPPGDVTAQFWESSLFRAVQRLADRPGRSVIEVRGSIWLDRPLEIRGGSDLVIRGRGDGDAKIEVARGVWSNLAAESGVIRVRNSSLTLQGVQLQATLRETGALPRTIIQVSGDSALETLHSEFTLHGDQPAQIHLVTLGDVGDDLAIGGAGTETTDPASTRLTMSHCFVRGSASVLRVNQSNLAGRDAVQVSISDSIVAVDGRLVDLAASTGQGGMERIVRLFCDWSTFVTGDGFAKLEHQGDELPVVGFSRTAQACVFWSRPGVAHLTILGNSFNLPSHPDLLLLQGLNNAYDQNIDRLCEINFLGERRQQLGFREGQQEGWFVERGNERVIRWRKSLDQLPPLRESQPADFELIKTHFVPGFRTAPSFSS